MAAVFPPHYLFPYSVIFFIFLRFEGIDVEQLVKINWSIYEMANIWKFQIAKIFSP